MFTMLMAFVFSPPVALTDSNPGPWLPAHSASAMEGSVPLAVNEIVSDKVYVRTISATDFDSWRRTNGRGGHEETVLASRGHSVAIASLTSGTQTVGWNLTSIQDGTKTYTHLIRAIKVPAGNIYFRQDTYDFSDEATPTIHQDRPFNVTHIVAVSGKDQTLATRAFGERLLTIARTSRTIFNADDYRHREIASWSAKALAAGSPVAAARANFIASAYRTLGDNTLTAAMARPRTNFNVHIEYRSDVSQAAEAYLTEFVRHASSVEALRSSSGTQLGTMIRESRHLSKAVEINVSGNGTLLLSVRLTDYRGMKRWAQF